MDGTKDDALYEDFLGEGVAETEDVCDMTNTQVFTVYY